ncbi:hypothetical protein EalM132_00103 [Exiguobacterium phage vB_EalM-132]|nr:hypothetical protein EalM132_00103 [Exiguobacterium phage vB_EalM-132]
MKVLKQTTHTVTVELTPLELMLLHKGSIREGYFRKKLWNSTDIVHPEELIYHATMRETIDGTKACLGSAVHEYKKRGILK